MFQHFLDKLQYKKFPCGISPLGCPFFPLSFYCLVFVTAASILSPHGILPNGFVYFRRLSNYCIVVQG